MKGLLKTLSKDVVNGIIQSGLTYQEHRHKKTQMNLQFNLDMDLIQFEKKLDERILILNKSLDLEFNHAIQSNELQNQIKLLHEKNVQEVNTINLMHLNKLDIIKTQHELKKQIENNKEIKEDIWPLNTPISLANLIEDVSFYNVLPLNIFVVKNNNQEYESFESELHDDIEDYFNYGQYNSLITGRWGAWKDNRFKKENINCLWKVMNITPVMIIKPIYEEKSDSYNFQIFLWGNDLNRINTPNYFHLEIGIKNNDDKELKKESIKELIQSICCYAGLFCDIYNMLISDHSPIIMPYAIKDKFNDFLIPSDVIDIYKNTIYNITKFNLFNKKTPLVYLKVVTAIFSIGTNEAKKSAESLLLESVVVWSSYQENKNIIEIPKTLIEAYLLIHDNESTYINDEYVIHFNSILYRWGILHHENNNDNIEDIYEKKLNEIYKEVLSGTSYIYKDILRRAVITYNKKFLLNIEFKKWRIERGYDHMAGYNIAEKILKDYCPSWLEDKKVQELAEEINIAYNNGVDR